MFITGPIINRFDIYCASFVTFAMFVLSCFSHLLAFTSCNSNVCRQFEWLTELCERCCHATRRLSLFLPHVVYGPSIHMGFLHMGFDFDVLKCITGGEWFVCKLL